MTAAATPQPRNDALGLTVDLTMIALAIINLSWVIFDSVWAITELRELAGLVIPMAWLNAYAPVHENFFKIDLIFVSVFLTEFLLRWLYAVRHNIFGHWMAYPIVHWYDLIGCIPVAGLRWLRILRIFAILYRLQRMGIIDYTRWSIYQFGKRIYDVIMEEISDRVVIRVLDGVQEEVRASHQLENQIIEQVIAPRREMITEAARQRVVHIGQQTYSRSREDLHRFITQTVSLAVRENREIRLIDSIPLVGGQVGKLLDHAITDIVCRVLDQFTERLTSAEFEALFADIADSLFEAFQTLVKEPGTSDQLSAAVIDILDVVKAQVAEKRWLHSPQTASA